MGQTPEQQPILEVRVNNPPQAVLTRVCSVTQAVDTLLFGDVDAAQDYCRVRWDVQLTEWEPYLIADDPLSSLKLNGKPVRYTGWRRNEENDTVTLHIHAVHQVVEF